MTNITIKQFKKEDLCLEDFSEERLYDYCTLEEFYEDIINIQKCPDEVYYYEGNEDFKYQVQSLFREEGE